MAPKNAPNPAALSNQPNVVAFPLKISLAKTGTKVVKGITTQLDAAIINTIDAKSGDDLR